MIFSTIDAPRSILVVKRDKVGDLLLATPMLRALRKAFPAARLDLLASDYNAWVVEGNNDVDRTWVYARTRLGRRVRPGAVLGQAALWLRLRARGYDVAIAANGEDSPRATRRALLVGARHTIAYAAREVRGLTHALPPPAAGHERERLMALLGPLGVGDDGAQPAWTPRPAALEEARAWLASRSLGEGRYIVIGLGARRAKKQPGAAQVLRWSEAARARGLATVFMWTPGASDNPLYPGDDAAAAEVLRLAGAHVHPYRGPLQPAAALAWLARRSLFPDSGLMHLAAASPGGVVGLFADAARSPPPAQWAPRGARAQWLEARESVAELDDAAVLAALLDG